VKAVVLYSYFILLGDDMSEKERFFNIKVIAPGEKPVNFDEIRHLLKQFADSPNLFDEYEEGKNFSLFNSSEKFGGLIFTFSNCLY
jgi:hypothetical protein